MYWCVLLGISGDRHQGWAKSLSLRSGQPSSSLGVGKFPNLRGRGAQVDAVPAGSWRVASPLPGGPTPRGDRQRGPRPIDRSNRATAVRNSAARKPVYIEIDIDLDITNQLRID